MAHEAHVAPLAPKVKNFHDAFVGSAIRWGRLNEIEMMGFYELKNSIDSLKKGDIKGIINEMLSQMKFARPMMEKGRMHFGFQSSKGWRELKKLYKKAKGRKEK
jgi:heterodisulfide reductase subunit C